MHLSFVKWGLLPRTWSGLRGILTMPLIHGDVEHLLANSFGLLFLGLGLPMFYPKVTGRVVLAGIFMSGAGVWLFARPAYHIGASALIYCLSSFIFFSGLFRRDRKSIGGALVVSFLFGASVWGVLPLEKGISWEGHLCGALTGILLAWRYRKIDLPLRPFDENEDGEEESLTEEHEYWNAPRHSEHADD